MKSLLTFLSILGLLVSSCVKDNDNKSDAMLQYGDKILTYQEVINQIPPGIAEEDSSALFTAIVDSWVKDEVLAQFAEERLYDTQSIDRKVNDYRNSLIVQEYLNKMREKQTPQVVESQVKEYYESHKNELKLEEPLIKGVFIKINSNMADKEELKKLLISESPENIDRLEQEWLNKVLEYNYFRDKWIDWQSISGMIPYRFENADKFLEEHNFFETEYEECTYYLQISEFLPSEGIQPFEYAKTWITNILSQGYLADYENTLVYSLVEKAIKDQKLQMNGYDVLKHEYTGNKKLKFK